MPRIAVIGSSPAYSYGFTPVQPLGDVDAAPGVATVTLNPEQVVGLIPLMPCDEKECREICDDGWKNPVFGELIGQSYQTGQTYENDWSTFLIDISLFGAVPSGVTVTFELERYIFGEWKSDPWGILLPTGSAGQIFPLGSISGHPTYAGYAINWGSILASIGAGCYRFKARTKFVTYMVSPSANSGVQATCTFNLPTNSCLVGAINGILQTSSGNIPAYYSFNQTNPLFTESQNIAFIVNFINTVPLASPYTATDNGGNSITITGQNYASNNGINFLLTTWKIIGGVTDCVQQWTTTMRLGENPDIITTPLEHLGCLVSPPFDLKAWDCMRAHGTVKFETWLSGLIGDPYTDYKLHDLCGMYWYDSIRTYGFIGYQKTPEYKTKNLEWGSPFHGKIEKISDEQIQRWEYLSKYLPEWLHSRFATFAMMSDKLFGSDYNINNSDYTIKRKNIVYDSGYEPDYIDKEAFWQRRHKSKVQVFFKRGVQSVIKSICCSIKGT